MDLIGFIRERGSVSDGELSEQVRSCNPKDAFIDLMNAVEDHIIVRVDGGWRIA